MAKEQYGMAKIGGYGATAQPQDPAYQGSGSKVQATKGAEQPGAPGEMYVILFLPYNEIPPDMQASLPCMPKVKGARYSPGVERLFGASPGVTYGANPQGQPDPHASQSYIALVVPGEYLAGIFGQEPGKAKAAPKARAPVRPAARAPTIDALAA